MTEKSYIDFGNETPYSPAGCGNWAVTIGIPIQSYYTMQILKVAINGVTVSSASVGYYASIFDSCTSNILLPSNIVNALKAQITNGNGLSSELKAYFGLQSFISGEIGLTVREGDLIWDNLPNLSFTLSSFTQVIKP